MSEPKPNELGEVLADIARAGVSAEPKDVLEGLQQLSQAECLQSLDELMARRHHNHRDLAFQIALWRRERCAWADARDAKRTAKEEGDTE